MVKKFKLVQKILNTVKKNLSDDQNILELADGIGIIRKKNIIQSKSQIRKFWVGFIAKE